MSNYENEQKTQPAEDANDTDAGTATDQQAERENEPKPDDQQK